MRNKLTRLIFFTCLAFLGIISLQVYWIYNSYLEKETKLESDISASMLTNQLLFVMKSHLMYPSNDSNMEATISKLLLSKNQIAPSDSSSRFNPFNSIQSFPINKYKEELAVSLRNHHLNIPFEVALIGQNGKIIKSSVSTFQFKAIAFKTNLETAPSLLLKYGKIAKPQIAIPGASQLLLSKILPIAVISTLLIVFCIVSLAYMISLFFKQKKISEIKNDFTNNMTHELKTPISSVTVALGLLRDDSAGMALAQKKEYFQIAENELQRLALLVDKVLKMAAFEKGEITLRPQFFAIKPWVESIVNPLRPTLDARNIKISITIYPETLKIRADKTNMSSVLQNLLDNAIKYADRKKDKSSIQIDAWQGDSDCFIAVQDNGIGIPFYHQAKIFDKFFRVPTGDEHETKGYGLGLSYVKEIIDLHGGKIEIDSTFHTGTRFKISIPNKTI